MGQSGGGPWHEHGTRKGRSRVCICLLLRLRLRRLHPWPVAGLFGFRHGHAAIGTAARPLAATLNRVWPDCRKLSRPAAFPPRFFGLPRRASPYAPYTFLVFLHTPPPAART